LTRFYLDLLTSLPAFQQLILLSLKLFVDLVKKSPLLTTGLQVLFH